MIKKEWHWMSDYKQKQIIMKVIKQSINDDFNNWVKESKSKSRKGSYVKNIKQYKKTGFNIKK
tara:strand:- start:8037 stop:8225 length:189 start_codon:yes stop_codon:yes gene_type:complete